MAVVPQLRLTTPSGLLALRELRRRDAHAWREVRGRNAAWLGPWEATVPPESDEQVPTFQQMVGRFRAEARAGRTLAWAMTLDEALVGQVTVGGITLGSLRAATIGYWIDRRVAGLGLTPLAVAMACDHCFRALRLHRIEIVVRPENHASLRVVDKLGFRPEGARPAYLHIDGDWRDHDVFALHAEEAPSSLVAAVLARHDPTR
ncbi:MAG: GNAT family N-acetyltransferase [Candidatus Nanopelagicales bacterium]|jgi:ribosomal-protein-alanine N-acetyltransferase|nr:GNAT family N-acetyltransferase [Candidatus Nanopelagicales bacterium]